MASLIVAPAAAAAVTLVATPAAMRAARRTGVVDRPGPLKPQSRSVPYLGGVAVFAGVAAGVAAFRPLLLVPLALAGALGLADDVVEIPPLLRLACEVVVAAVAGAVAPVPVVAGGVLTAVAVVGLVNALNLLDGLDGLASGVVLVAALGFAAVGGDARPLAWAVAGAAAAFLVFNRPPARIYLGDCGAYLLGVALAVMAARAAPTAESGWAAAPLLVAVPVVDTAIAIARRVRSGRSVLEGDRSHVYDQLVDRGLPRVAAAAACVAVAAVLAAGVLAAQLAAPGAAVVVVVSLAALAVLVWRGRFLAPRLPEESP